MADTVKRTLEETPEGSVVGGLVRRLIEQLTQPPPRPHVHGTTIEKPLPKLGTPPKDEVRDASPMFELMKTVSELMKWTTQCLNDSIDDVTWTDDVLNPMELEELLPKLRSATIMTRYNIHRNVPYNVKETNVYQMIFVIETRLHLFCYEREWMARDLKDHVTLDSLPTIAAMVPDGCQDPFLFMSMSATRHVGVKISNKWMHLSRESGIDTDELTEAVYWLFSRVSILLNYPYEDDVMDEGGFVQQISETHFMADLDFLAAVAPFFYGVSSDFELYSRLLECHEPPSQELQDYVSQSRAGLESWVRHVLERAVADDLVMKYAEAYCKTEALMDIGGTMRTETVVTPEFGKYKQIEAFIEDASSNQILLNTVWCFAMSYILEQSFMALQFVHTIYRPRLEPKFLEGNMFSHPLIVRIPIINNFAVLSERNKCIGVFSDLFDAVLVWFWVLKTHYRARVRHQESNLWIDLSSIQTKIERFTRSRLVPPKE